ncbi:Acyl-coenzyme A thioesterase THEM4 [Hondaea fermentalgiana]|uniref:Acyl-coenzyme A thioesterase THEM4 n=1 Tax=Hondaea fermentalgiana TaxID=2315210 RepID=A0A2R5GL58_9STRA|nr:Acyl-coenzyme A thioesterase THEM4 [Hondaea fermentalgiana]|eukprot:GBG29011.1 Acyl-coenzyme A thioesterase THEM4 [Hondaea fermentalgiana]
MISAGNEGTAPETTREEAARMRAVSREHSYFWASGKVVVGEDTREQDASCEIEFTPRAQGPPMAAHGGSSAAAHGVLLAGPCAEIAGVPEMALAIKYTKLTYLKLTALGETHAFKMLECGSAENDDAQVYGRGRISDVSGNPLTESEVRYTNVLNMRLVQTLRTDEEALASSPLFMTTVGQTMESVRNGAFGLRGEPLVAEHLLESYDPSKIVPGLIVHPNMGPPALEQERQSYDFGPQNNMSLWSAYSKETTSISSLLSVRSATSQADSLIDDKPNLSTGGIFVALDHIMGHTVMLSGSHCVTAFLEIEYHQAIEIDPSAFSFVYLHAYIEKIEGRKVFVRGSVHAVTLEGAQSGNPEDWRKMPEIATGSGLFIHMSFPGHPGHEHTESKL